jgi:hypothetical protein
MEWEIATRITAALQRQGFHLLAVIANARIRVHHYGERGMKMTSSF